MALLTSVTCDDAFLPQICYMLHSVCTSRICSQFHTRPEHTLTDPAACPTWWFLLLLYHK